MGKTEGVNHRNQHRRIQAHNAYNGNKQLYGAVEAAVFPGARLQLFGLQRLQNVDDAGEGDGRFLDSV